MLIVMALFSIVWWGLGRCARNDMDTWRIFSLKSFLRRWRVPVIIIFSFIHPLNSIGIGIVVRQKMHCAVKELKYLSFWWHIFTNTWCSDNIWFWMLPKYSFIAVALQSSCCCKQDPHVTEETEISVASTLWVRKTITDHRASQVPLWESMLECWTCISNHSSKGFQWQSILDFYAGILLGTTLHFANQPQYSYIQYKHLRNVSFVKYLIVPDFLNIAHCGLIGQPQRYMFNVKVFAPPLIMTFCSGTLKLHSRVNTAQKAFLGLWWGSDSGVWTFHWESQ